jgi:acetylornithine deacetylase
LEIPNKKKLAFKRCIGYFCYHRREAHLELFDLVAALVKLESPTGSEQSVTQFLQNYLEAAGFAVRFQEVGEERCNLYAHVGEPVCVFSTHTDTVLPGLPFREDEEFIYGRGACDAKGIIAAQVKAAEKLFAAGARNFGLLFVVGAERGSDGAKAVNTIPNRCHFLINGEPTQNKLALGSKGALRVEVTTAGRAAHSAYPLQGESAILRLLDVLNDVRGLVLPSQALLGETTCNIGTISGGIQANVIPDAARAELMFRTVTETRVIKNLLAEAIGTRAALQYTFECAPVFLEALAVFETTVVAYTTDIPLLTNWGRPFLLGPGSILDAHTPHERIAKKELQRAVEIYFEMANRLLNAVPNKENYE